MNSDKIWITVFFIGTALWLFVFASTLINLSKNVLVDRNFDISIPTLMLLALISFYLSMSIFVNVVYLMAFNRVKDHQIKMRSNKIFYDNKDNLCSIIIPARNEESVIRKNVLSCLKQTHRNIEVIVVCHNSSDRTFEQAHVGDERVKVFDVRTNESGKSIALNYGVEHSNGKFILVVDADHVLSEDFIENALPVFGEPYAAVQGSVRPSNRNYNFITKILSMEDDLWSAPFLTVRHLFGNRCPLSGTGFIIRRDILIKVGMFAKHLVDDAELTYRLLRKKYRIAYVPLSVVYGEEPPAIGIMLRQRARWARGFLGLLNYKVIEPNDVIGNIYWLGPVVTYCAIATLFIAAYGSIHNLLLGYYPYAFSYLPLKLWFLAMGLNFVLSTLVLVKQHGRKGIKYATYLPLYMIFSQYSLAISLKAFFVKSWGTTKTTHGFIVKSEIGA